MLTWNTRCIGKIIYFSRFIITYWRALCLNKELKSIFKNILSGVFLYFIVRSVQLNFFFLIKNTLVHNLSNNDKTSAIFTTIQTLIKISEKESNYPINWFQNTIVINWDKLFRSMIERMGPNHKKELLKSGKKKWTSYLL